MPEVHSYSQYAPFFHRVLLAVSREHGILTCMNGKTLGIIAVVIIIIAGGIYLFLNYAQPADSGAQTDTMNNSQQAQLPTDTVGVQDTVVGTGAEAKSGSKVTVNYTGALTDGTVFDSSIPKGVPFVFTLGEGKVIAGWEAGLLGMKVGGKRLLVIPPQFGYGAQAYGPIPANSTLVFEVELLKVE